MKCRKCCLEWKTILFPAAFSFNQICMKYIIFTLLALLIISKSLLSQESSFDKVEPPFWWKSMNNSELQIMFHGENISHLKAKIEEEGINLLRTEKTNNPNYLFLYIDIDKSFSPNSFEIQFLLQNNEISSVNYELKDRIENSELRQGFNSADVIYLITPDRFANGNTENDYYEKLGDKLDRTDEQARHGGDIQGIINSLDYIKDMGFTTIWINPLLINQMPRTSYHGYATTDYYQIDPRFGTLNDYIKLSEEANKRGIKIVMDQIMNHCGSEHWWMKDLPDSNWFNDKEKFQITNHRRTVIKDPYAAPSDKEKFIRGWFVDQMPDLNGDHPLLRDYMIQNSIWWVEVANLGGIRHDTHCYPGAPFMSAYTCAIMNEYPNFNIVGEEWSENPIIVSKWQRGNQLTIDLESCIPSMMDFPLQATLIRSLQQEENWNTGLNNLYELIACDYIYPDPNNLVIFPDNHDMDRYYTQLNEDIDLYKMGLVYLFTIRGIPQIYYGTEILMSNPMSHSHGEIRTDFPGGWKNDPSSAFTGIGLSVEQKESQSFVKLLLNWRKNNPSIHFGNLMHYAPDNGLYVYFRYDNKNRVMVILNKSNESRNILRSQYPKMLKSYHKGYSVLNDEELSLDDLKIPARSAYIIELYQ